MKKLICLVPNIITFLNLFCGFSSIYFSFTGKIDLAAMSIMLATIFDMLDGRLARVLGVTSEIGKELDSFSDLTTFGIAPAFLFFNFSRSFGVLSEPLLLVISFLFVVCATTRLAFYNVKTDSETPVHFFTGMPSTFAGISLAVLLGFNQTTDGLTWFLKEYFNYTFSLPFSFWIYLIFFAGYAFLMVSKIPYAKSNSRLFNFRSFWNIMYNFGFFFFLIIAFKFFVLIIVLVYSISPLIRKLRG